MSYAPVATYQPGNPSGPVTVQPAPLPPGAACQWMPAPPPLADVPPGLEYLTQIDRLFVKQKREYIEMVTDWEAANRYTIFNGNGQQVYYAIEESGMCMRQCCKTGRSFVMHIIDNLNREVLTLQRPFKYCPGSCGGLLGCGCCSDRCFIWSNGQLLGSVFETPSCFTSSFSIQDVHDQEILKISGPCCVSLLMCQDKIFPVRATNGDQIGEVNKVWAGFCQEAYTDADNFGISFPLNLDVKAKALLIGAVFLIDFIQFEDQQNNNMNRRTGVYY